MATKAEIIDRTKAIEKWLLDGLSYTQIVEKARQSWDIHKAQTSKYIKHATKKIQRNADKLSPIRFYRSLDRKYKLKDMAEEKEDLRLMLEIEKEIDKLENNLPDKTQKVEHTGPGGGPIQFNLNPVKGK